MAVRQTPTPGIFEVTGYDPTADNLFGLDVLHQDEVWRDKEGNLHRLDEMMRSHRRNLLAFLRRRPLTLALADQMAAVSSPFAPRGDMACAAMEEFMDWQTDNAEEWLEGTPLVKRLAELVAADEAAAAERAAQEVPY